MAVSYPGISYLRGYEPKDPLEQFAKGFGFGEGIRNEAGAKDALSAYIDSLTGGQAQAAAGSQRNVVDQSIASARAAQPPAELTAALDAKYKPGDAAGRAMQFFMSKGYSQPQAAGIVGNLMQESGLDVAAINPGDGRDGSDSIGIAQWNGPRAQALQAYATQNGLDLNDLDTQFGFIDHELRSTEKDAFNRLMQAQDPIQAAAAFAGYERPAGWSPENPYNSHGWGNRARHAAHLAGGTYDAPQQVPAAGRVDGEAIRGLLMNPLTRQFGMEVWKAQVTGSEMPASVREYQFAQRQGFQGSLLDFEMEKRNSGNAGNLPSKVREYQFYSDQESEAGRVPMSFNDWDQQSSSGLTVTTNPDGTTTVTQGKMKLTEAQGKDVVYYTRGLEANTDLASMDKQLTDLGGQMSGLVPLGLGNYARTPAFRQAKVAADNFLAAVLRKDTGAAITTHEFEMYGPMFLPVPGDDPGTIQQKARMREVALLAIRSGLGTAEAVAEANRIALGVESDTPILDAQGDEDTPVVSTQDEYDALPSGAIYREDDGKTYRKP